MSQLIFLLLFLIRVCPFCRKSEKKHTKPLNLSHLRLSTEIEIIVLTLLLCACQILIGRWVEVQNTTSLFLQIFWEQWCHKGARKKLKILIVSDMVQGFHLDANSFCSQSKNVFFQVGPDESENSNGINKVLQKVSKLKIYLTFSCINYKLL